MTDPDTLDTELETILQALELNYPNDYGLLKSQIENILGTRE